MPQDVVFTFSTETLKDAHIRGFMRPPDKLLETLNHAPAVDDLLVVDAPRWVFSIAKQGRDPWPAALGPARSHLRPWRIGRQEPISPSGVARHVARHEAQIRRRCDRLQLSAPAVVTFDPLLAGFGEFDWAGPVTFYARDDWASFPPREPWWPAYHRAFERLRETGRGVLAVSEQILERIRPTGPAAVISNGIDPAEWFEPRTVPDWYRDLPRPIHIYAGTVDDRVDMSLVAALAATPGTTLLVGPGEKSHRRAVLQAGAKHYVASDRTELASLVSGANVGLIPHCTTELTKAMCPLKLFEYRAAGLPVAAVDLPPIATEAAQDGGILLARPGPAGFIEAASMAVQRGPDPIAARRSYATRAAWAARHQQALEIILRS